MIKKQKSKKENKTRNKKFESFTNTAFIDR
jgi:hypothetical protein